MDEYSEIEKACEDLFSIFVHSKDFLTFTKVL